MDRITDDRGNSWTIAYWGTREAAQTAADSCSDCSGCSNMAPAKQTNIPVIPDIHKRLAAAISDQGCSIEMNQWHSCKTTHCRAGWVIHLAGKEGYALEKATSSVFAAMQIYRASGYDISPCRFYDSNEDAMRDILRLAAES